LNFGILQNVFSYVGLGHSLFVALVSKSWRKLYFKLKSMQRASYAVERGSVETCITGKMTLHSSVFTSPSRVSFAQECGLASTTKDYQRAAGKHADVATLAAAHELGMEYKDITLTSAARYNKLAELQYLHSQGCVWPLGLLEVAATSGHLELLRWCHEHGCPFREVRMAPAHAAQSGNVELMAWVLQQPGTQLSVHAMKAAAVAGRLAMCKCLYAQQCPWDSSSTSAAACHGHVDVLHWLCDNSCPWEARELCVSAAQGGSVAVLTHLQQQGLLDSVALLTELLDEAAMACELAAAKWLRAQGAEWPAAFDYYDFGNAVTTWAEAEGCIPSTEYSSNSDYSSEG
jgi:hypothetical protein